MRIKDIVSRLRFVNKTVDFLEKKTDKIHQDFEDLDGCYSPPCEEEKSRLRKEMGSCLDKLRLENKELDRCETKFHACSGELA